MKYIKLDNDNNTIIDIDSIIYISIKYNHLELEIGLKNHTLGLIYSDIDTCDNDYGIIKNLILLKNNFTINISKPKYISSDTYSINIEVDVTDYEITQINEFDIIIFQDQLKYLLTSIQ